MCACSPSSDQSADTNKSAVSCYWHSKSTHFFLLSDLWCFALDSEGTAETRTILKDWTSSNDYKCRDSSSYSICETGLLFRRPPRKFCTNFLELLSFRRILSRGGAQESISPPSYGNWSRRRAAGRPGDTARLKSTCRAPERRRGPAPAGPHTAGAAAGGGPAAPRGE